MGGVRTYCRPPRLALPAGFEGGGFRSEEAFEAEVDFDDVPEARADDDLAMAPQ